MGKTQLRPKIVDLFSVETQNNNANQLHFRQMGKSLQNEKNKEQTDFYGTRKMALKPKKSKSIPEKQAEAHYNLNPTYLN